VAWVGPVCVQEPRPAGLLGSVAWGRRLEVAVARVGPVCVQERRPAGPPERVLPRRRSMGPALWARPVQAAAPLT
jgi:hypothetical protein